LSAECADGDAGILAALHDVVLCASESGSWHWSGFIVAEVDGKLAAGLSGYDSRIKTVDGYNASLRAALVERRGWSEEQWDEYLRRRAIITTVICRCDHNDDKGWWVVDFVATLPEFRGLGLMHRLLLDILQEGRNHGLTRSKLLMVVGNTSAQRAYEKVGFTEVPLSNTVGDLRPCLIREHIDSTSTTP